VLKLSNLRWNMKIGIDVGGTLIHSVLVNNGKILKSKEFEIQERDTKSLKALIFRSVEEVMKEKVSGIGIVLPGQINYKGGFLVKAPNLKPLEGVKLRDLISAKFGCKTNIENDANSFALAESVFGSGKHFNNMICLTLGTGVGGGIIINKKLYRGSDAAGEPGHIIVVEGGRKCSCGARGCLEEYASLKGMMHLSKDVLGKEMNSKDLAKLAETDEKARSIFYEMGKHLGTGLATMANLLDPDIIVVGGGLSNISWILESAEKEMRNNLFRPESKLKMVKSNLGDNAVVLGASLI